MMRRIATTLGVAGALIALVFPAASQAAFGPATPSSFGGTGSGSGQLSGPLGAAIDSSGRVYVADPGNKRIDRFSSTGTSPASWGTLLNSNFAPSDIAVGPNGVVYTAGPGGVDEFNGSLPIRHFDSAGAYGIAVDSSSNVYVSDQTTKQIHKYKADGTLLGSFGVPGSGDGQFATPYGLTTDSSDNVWVADPGNGRIEEFNSDGDFLSQIAMPEYTIGSVHGTMDPRDVAVDGSGRVFAPDAGVHSNLVAVFNAAGTLQQLFGSPDNQPSNSCAVNAPRGIAISSTGTLYVVDTGDDAVKMFNESSTPACVTPSITTTGTAGVGGTPASGPPPGPDTKAPVITLSGFPRGKCARHNFSFLINITDDGVIDRLTLFVQGRKAASNQIGQPAFTVRVNMPINKVRREIPRGFRLKVQIAVKVTDTAGHKSKAKHTFSICGAG
jgi:sugar lactone lactonase YvrE